MMNEDVNHGMTTISVRDDENYMMDDVEILSEPYVPRHDLCGPRRRVIALGIGLVVIVLIVIISVTASNNSNSNGNQASDSPNKALPPQDQALFSEVKVALDALNVSTTDMLVKDTYQYKAFTWLTHEDNDNYNRTQLLQRYSLAALFYSTNDVPHEYSEKPGPWISKFNWLTADPECDWEGITCDNQGKVNSIVLERNNLSGKIPLDLELMRDPLRTLDLSENEIIMKEQDFVIFERLHRLTHLQLDDNYIYTANGLPTELKALTNLVLLNASYTLMDGDLDNGVLDTLTKLTHLELEDNWFTGPPHFLGNMSSLVYVYLSRNSLFGHLNFLKTGKLTNLLEIWLDHNTIQSTLPTEIAQLTSLQSFSCVNTSLTGTIPSQLGALPKLNRIWLHDNKIKGTVPTELAKLTKLEVLDVHHNELGGTMPSGVCSAINASTYAKKALQADCKEVNCTCCTKCY